MTPRSARVPLGGLSEDVRHAIRVLRLHGGFTVAALLMLALGIGATTAIFSVLHAVLIKPLPYPHSDALIDVVHSVNGADLAYFSDRVYLTYAANNQTFQAFGVWSAGTASITGGGVEGPVTRSTSQSALSA